MDMRSGIRVLAAAAAFVGFSSVPVFAQQSATDTVTVSAVVAATAKLTLSSNTVSFADADPDTTPSISAAALTIGAKAKTSGGSAVTLTVQADGPLTSGGDTIAESNLTWTVTGSGFAAGTMSSASAVSLGSWTNSGNRSGTQTYVLANSWSYATGNYTMTVTYTLSAP
jgi:hypothetical protein